MEDFSTCVRITVLTVSYLIPSVFFVNNMLVRRRSQTLRVVVISVGLLTKNVVIAYLLPNSSLDELIVMEIRFLYAVLFAFVTYFSDLLYLLWQHTEAGYNSDSNRNKLFHFLFYAFIVCKQDRGKKRSWWLWNYLSATGSFNDSRCIWAVLAGNLFVETLVAENQNF